VACAAAATAVWAGCGACGESAAPPTPDRAAARAEAERAAPAPLARLPQAEERPAEAPSAAAPAPEPAAPQEPLRIEDGLPSDVPRHPGSSPLEARTLPNGDLLSGFETGDDAADVFVRLQEDFEARGWTLDHVLEGHGQRVIRASKGDRQVIAMVVEQGGATRVAVRATLD